MSIRFIALLGGAALFVTATGALAESQPKDKSKDKSTDKSTNTISGGKISDNESPRPQDRTTVKSSKSNTSDRMGGGGGKSK